MKDVILLTKTLLKGSGTQIGNENGKKISGLGKVLLYIVVYSYIAGIMGYIGYKIMSAMIIFGQARIFLDIAFSGMAMFIILQTMVSGLNILFFSKDIEILLPLPIKSEKIIMAKINCLIIVQYFLCAIILLPIVVVYGVLLKTGILYYVMSLLSMILFPIIPVTIISFIVTIITKFTNVIKNKDLVQYFTIAITIILVLGIQLIPGMSGNQEITDEQMLEAMMKTDSITQNLSIFLINLRPTVNSIVNFNNIEGIKNLAILLVESILVYFVIIKLMSKTYIKSVTNSITSGINSNKKVNFKKDFSKKNTLVSYVKKEFKILVRNPIFFMQCVLPSILLPLIMTVSMYLSLNNMENAGDIAILLNYANTPMFLGVALIAISFFFAFNFISITAISRDGEYSTFSKYIPIDLEKQIFYKIVPGIILNIIPIIYVLIAIKIIVPITSLDILLYIAVLAMLMNFFNNYCMILVDFKNPKLKWISEYTVVKQNINMLLEILLFCIEGLIIFGLSFKIDNLESLETVLMFGFVVLTILIKKYIKKNKFNLYKKIS